MRKPPLVRDIFSCLCNQKETLCNQKETLAEPLDHHVGRFDESGSRIAFFQL